MSAAEVKLIDSASPVSTARSRVERIRTSIEDLKLLIVEAYQEKDWEALGYESWTAYCTAEFAGSIAIPREERGDVVFTLRNAGLSTRAIAAATGMSKDTVHRASRVVSDETTARGRSPQEHIQRAERLAGEQGDPSPTNVIRNLMPLPAADPDDEIVDAEIVPTPPAKITGTDGKSYSPIAKSTGRRKPWPDAYRDTIRALGRVSTTITNLCNDDRMETNVQKRGPGLANDRRSHIEALTEALTEALRLIEEAVSE